MKDRINCLKQSRNQYLIDSEIFKKSLNCTCAILAIHDICLKTSRLWYRIIFQDCLNRFELFFIFNFNPTKVRKITTNASDVVDVLRVVW